MGIVEVEGGSDNCQNIPKCDLRGQRDRNCSQTKPNDDVLVDKI